jgi:hypothetical protein
LEEFIVKKMMYVLMFAGLVFLFVTGCGSSGDSTKPEPIESPQVSSAVRRPDLLDHKNYVFGRDVPEWVMMDQGEIETLDRYKNDYVFKFQSPGAQNLQGAELWTKNFTANSEIAAQIRTRVQAKFAGSAAGDMNDLVSYMENTVKSLSDATFSGYRERENYWIQQRHYKADGSVDRDDFTYYSLYTIPRSTLDQLVNKALNDADIADKPKTENERTARERVKEAFAEGF